MFEYLGPEGARQNAQRLISYIGLNNIPEGAHRLRMERLQSEGVAFNAVTIGSEAIYALLVDAEVSLPEPIRDQLIEALGTLSRAALEWRAKGMVDRWAELQAWAYAIYTGEEPPAEPAVDPEYIIQADPPEEPATE